MELESARAYRAIVCDDEDDDKVLALEGPMGWTFYRFELTGWRVLPEDEAQEAKRQLWAIIESKLEDDTK